MIHGEKKLKNITVNNGRQHFVKTVRFCVLHGEIDCLHEPDAVWNIKHAECHLEHFHELKISDRSALSAAQNYEILKAAAAEFELKKRGLSTRDQVRRLIRDSGRNFRRGAFAK